MNTISLIVRKKLNLLVGILLFASIATSLSMPLFVSAQATPATGAQQTEQPVPSKCDGGFFSMSTLKPSCWIPSMIGIVTASMIYLAAWVLAIAGILFNLLVDHTIVHFGDTLYGPAVKSAVETAWTAFRDISNIIIIGMFVFVAISTILGNVEYGAKKWIAKIIIVAVLINFSLLFTKVIIDFSNFSALQFYNAAQLQAGNPNASTGANPVGNQFAQKGISGAFINYMGVTSFGDSKEAVKRVAVANDSNMIALLHGVMSSIFLLAAAMVLFYGSFLLASRALLLIFLLLTSSIAFATHLIPIKAVSGSNFGWSAWWSNLLKTAVFAPLLMIFLWVSLSVAQALKVKSGTLGDLMTNPTKISNMEALFSYLIVLGLLYISFKIAASFSTGIGNFNYAAVLPAIGLSAGARTAAMATRLVVGGTGMAVGSALQKASQNPNRGDWSRKMYDLSAKPFIAASKKDFNTMRTPLGGGIAQTLKLKKPDALAGPKVGGMDGTVNAMAKSIKDQAKRITPSDAAIKEKFEREQREKAVREAAPLKPDLKPVERPPIADKPTPAASDIKKDEETVRAEALKEALAHEPDMRKKHEEAQTIVKLSKEDIASINRSHDDTQSKLVQSIKGLREQQTTLRSNKSDTIAITRADEIEKEIQKSQAEIGRSFKQRNEKIQEATAKSQQATTELQAIEKKALANMKEREENQAKQTTRLKKQDEAAFKEYKKAYGTEAIATRIADKSVAGRLLKSLGMPGKLAKTAVKGLEEDTKRAAAKLQAEENAKAAPKPAAEDDKH